MTSAALRVRAATPLATPLIAVGVGALVAHGGRAPLLLAAVGIAAASVGLRARPALAAVLAVAVMALPYTWAPHLSKIGTGFGVLVGLFLLVTFLPRSSGFRPTAFDLVVIAIAVTPAAISLLQGQPFHPTQWLAPAILLPYFGFRVLLREPDAHAAFVPAVVVVGVIVALLGIWESLSGRNPLVAPARPAVTDVAYVTTWNVPLHRNGHLRAESTFGHPIAFGMFLLIPLAFALAGRSRRYVLAAVLVLGACILTYSRGPWIAAAVVVALMLGWGRRRVLLAGCAGAAAVVVLNPVRTVILESGRSHTEAGANASYRLGLLSEAFHHLTLLGRPFADLQTSIPNFPDVTSLLAATIVQTGVVGLLELLVLGWLALRALAKARAGDDAERLAAAVALVASLVGLLAVTLITSYQFFFWALVAFVAQAEVRARSASDGDQALPVAEQGRSQ